MGVLREAFKRMPNDAEKASIEPSKESLHQEMNKDFDDKEKMDLEKTGRIIGVMTLILYLLILYYGGQYLASIGFLDIKKS